MTQVLPFADNGTLRSIAISKGVLRDAELMRLPGTDFSLHRLPFP